MHDAEPTADASGSHLRAAVKWVPSVLWATLIFRLSAIPGSDVPPGDYGSLAHFTVYAVLGALLFLALAREQGAVRAACLAVVISSAYGVTDEVHQAFVPGRVPDVVDWGLDTLGAGVGAFTSLGVHRYLQRRRAESGGTVPGRPEGSG